MRAVGVCAGARQARGDGVEAILRGVDHPVDRRGGVGPDRGDQEQFVGKAIEDEDHRRAHEDHVGRSEEHTSELQSLMRISYAVFCLKKKTTKEEIHKETHELQTKEL